MGDRQVEGCAGFTACDTVTNCPVQYGRDQGYTCALGRLYPNAGVAQLVEHLICNQRVRGSNPFASSSMRKSVNEFPAGSWTQ